MILGLSVFGLIWCAVTLFVASFVRGYAGFGFTAVLLIGMTHVLPLAEIVPLSIALEVIASLGQARGIIDHIRWKQLSVLLFTGLIGTPIGVYLLGELPDSILRVSGLGFILIASFFLIFMRVRPLGVSLWVFALAGFAAGFVNGATALSGLVLGLFFTLTREKAAKMRATIIAYLFVTDIWTGGFLIKSGFYDNLTATRILLALPVLGLGVWLGSRRFGATRPENFRSVVLWILLTLSTAGLILIATG